MRAVRAGVGEEIRGIIREALETGQRVAEMEAPRSGERFHEGAKIRDSIRIRIDQDSFAPGGSGGGGFYEGHLYVDSELAPQVRWVMEGTADEGAGLITPARGNVFPIEKNGEGVRFRSWVHGQRPQRIWWDLAREAVLRELSIGMDSIK